MNIIICRGAKMTKKLLKDDQSINKKKILKAALEVFSKKGFQHTTIREISAKSNLSTGTIYFHYKNKDEILKEAIKNTELIKLRSVSEKINELSPNELIKGINLELTKNMANNFETLLLFINAGESNQNLSDFFYEQFKSKNRELTELCKQLIKNGSIRKMNPEKAAIFILSNIFTMVLLKESILKKNLDKNYYIEMHEFIMDILENGFFTKK